MVKTGYISERNTASAIQRNENTYSTDLIKQLFAGRIVLNGKLQLRIHRQHSHVYLQENHSYSTTDLPRTTNRKQQKAA